MELMQHRHQLAQVSEGVSNFRKFQLDATRKLGFVYGATWLGGIIGVILLSLLAWALTQLVPAGKMILDDYYHTHPALLHEQKSHSDAMERVYAESNPQQMSRLP